MPGELRSYRAVLGSQLLDLQLKIERAWAEAAEGGEGGGQEQEGAVSEGVMYIVEVEEALVNPKRTCVLLVQKDKY